MGNPLISLLTIFVVGYICRRYLHATKSRSRLPFPPGPKPKPLIGNALELPTRTAWLTYTEWTETYKSDILHAEALGQHIVVLNSLEDAIELLERRASNYSNRPALPMLELMDWVDFNAAVLPHGDLWRRHRRVFQQSFKKDTVVAYEPIQMRKVHQMLRGLLASPDDLQSHIRTVAAAVIMGIVYGLDITAMNDKFVLIAEEAVDHAVKAILPGAVLVNMIPALRHIPPWFPGARFHQAAGKIRELTYQMQNATFDFVRKNMKEGTGKPSLLASLPEVNDANGGSAEYETLLKGVSATAYAAGADTTVSAIATFFYAMATNPDAQWKAQGEIDAVIGSGRLPEHGDRSSLPYVEALYREMMSIRGSSFRKVILPSQRRSSLISLSGSIVIPNIWAMTHDKNVYKDPDTFRPERHFDDHGELNTHDTILTYGFGRRVCVGRHLASSTVWLVIASVLATLNVAKAKDSEGKDIEIEGRYTDGVISHPYPFSCSITARSPKARELICSDE